MDEVAMLEGLVVLVERGLLGRELADAVVDVPRQVLVDHGKQHKHLLVHVDL